MRATNKMTHNTPKKQDELPKYTQVAQLVKKESNVFIQHFSHGHCFSLIEKCCSNI